LLCEDCAEAEYVRYWVWERRDQWAVAYRCPPDCPFYPPGKFRLSLSDASSAYEAHRKPLREKERAARARRREKSG